MGLENQAPWWYHMPEHLSWSSCSPPISEDPGEAILELLTTVVFAFAPGLIAPVWWFQHCQGRDAHQDEHQTVDRHMHLVGKVYNHNMGKTSIAALLLAEPDLTSQVRPR